MFWEEEAAAQGVGPVRTSGAVPEFDPVAFGARLRQARRAAGWKQQPLARELDVTQPTYSRMESGRIAAGRVTSTFLEDLSRLLGRTMSWFLVGSPVRDRVRLAARRTDEGEVRVRAERVLDLLEMDAELDDLTEFADLEGAALESGGRSTTWTAHAVKAPAHPSRQQGRNLAEKLRGDLNLGDGPIEDLPDLLDGVLGVDAAVLALGDRLSAVAAFDDERSVALLAVNVSDTYARQRFSFAHEVAHLLYGEGHAYDGEHGASRSPLEVRADKFAQHLLLPVSGIQTWAAARGYAPRQRFSFEDACRLADEFGVSPQTAWIALDDMGVAPLGPFPTAAEAAVVAGHLARHTRRERDRRVERIPLRLEGRVLEAFRQGYLGAEATARILGQARDLLEDVTSVVAAPAPRRTRDSRVPAHR